MAVFRINKTSNYTVMSNRHFQEKGMSLKAKGLLSLMLSLPDSWDYSAAGLVALSSDGRDGVSAGLRELETFGYLKRVRSQNQSGQFSGYDYEIYEEPQPEEPSTDSPTTEEPLTENPLTEEPLTEEPLTEEPLTENPKQYKNTNTIKNETNKKRSNKNKYGQFENVLLTDEEFQKLKERFTDYQNRIEALSAYIASKGKKYHSHYATIISWARKDDKPKIEALSEDLMRRGVATIKNGRYYSASGNEININAVDDLPF